MHPLLLFIWKHEVLASKFSLSIVFSDDNSNEDVHDKEITDNYDKHKE